MTIPYHPLLYENIGSLDPSTHGNMKACHCIAAKRLLSMQPEWVLRQTNSTSINHHQNSGNCYQGMAEMSSTSGKMRLISQTIFGLIAAHT